MERPSFFMPHARAGKGAFPHGPQALRPGPDDLVGQGKAGHHVHHVGGLAHLLGFQQVEEVQTGPADKDADAVAFQLLQGIQALALRGRQLDAAVEQHDAPQGGPQFGQAGQEVFHQAGAQFVIAAAQGIGGDEDQGLAAFRVRCRSGGRGLFRGFHLCGAAQAVHFPQGVFGLVDADFKAAAAQKAAHVLAGGSVVHQDEQLLRPSLFQGVAGVHHRLGAGKAPTIQGFHSYPPDGFVPASCRWCQYARCGRQGREGSGTGGMPRVWGHDWLMLPDGGGRGGLPASGVQAFLTCLLAAAFPACFGDGQARAETLPEPGKRKIFSSPGERSCGRGGPAHCRKSGGVVDQMPVAG